MIHIYKGGAMAVGFTLRTDATYYSACGLNMFFRPFHSHSIFTPFASRVDNVLRGRP